MKKCSKCNSENIERTDPSARRKLEGEKQLEIGDQMVVYTCLDCWNTKSVKFSEDE